MTTALVSKEFITQFGDALKAVGERAGKFVSFMTLPDEKGARLSQADCDRIDCAFLDRDMRFNEQRYAAYSEALLKMNHLKWVHFTSSGIGQQLYVSELIAKGVITTSSTGSASGRSSADSTMNRSASASRSCSMNGAGSIELNSCLNSRMRISMR